MKAGPIVAMIALIAVGMWLVLQPTLERGAYDLTIGVGAEQLLVNLTPGAGGEPTRYEFVAPPQLAELGPLEAPAYERVIAERKAAWDARPAWERALLGFFNITSWVNFGWVAVGLLGQAAFFGRMFIQWVVSEKTRESQVPELFWWFSFIGGVFLFTYFVWRVDVVGVLGQSTGVVIYARNLRLIHKQKRRDRRARERPADGAATSASPEPGEAPGGGPRGDQPT
ncbi:MAG: lipid-A-disaccharide synthase N-terminal domain-containing protein [Phycisphaerales bacterium JB040]